MGNGFTKRSFCGSLRVHMQVLVVVGRIGKLVDLGLRDFKPVRLTTNGLCHENIPVKVSGGAIGREIPGSPGQPYPAW